MSKPKVTNKAKECEKHGKVDIIKINLGPWAVDKGYKGSDGKALAAAMGDEAWKTVDKTCDFTPVEAPKNKADVKGFAIAGSLITVDSKPGKKDVKATFTITVDGGLSNFAMSGGGGSAFGGMTAEDVLRAVVEDKVNQFLDAIRAGRVKKYGG